MGVSPSLVLHAVGYIIRNLLAVDPTNPSHSHIDAGRDTAGSKDVAVFHPAR